MQSPRSACDIEYSDPITTWLLKINHTQLPHTTNISDASSLIDLEKLSLEFDLLDSVSPHLCQAIHVIIYYVPPILFLVGTFGNLLSFSVLSRRSILYPSSYIYLAVLALVDECVLVVGLLRRWTDRLAGRRLEDRHWILCKILNFTGVTASCLSVWIIVAVTVERALIIILPLQSSQATRMRRSKFIMLCLTLTIIGITSHFFVTVDIATEYSTATAPSTSSSSSSSSSTSSFASSVYDGNVSGHMLLKSNIDDTIESDITSPEAVQVCEFRRPFVKNGLQRVWIWIDATLYSYLPFFLITIFNVIILVNLHEASRRRASLANNWPTNPQKPKMKQSILHRGWRSLSTFCHCRQRVEAPRLRVCQFCAQSFPIDRFHEPPEFLGSANRGCGLPTYPNSHLLLHSLSEHMANDRWPARAYTPAVNIKFGPSRMNGYEIKTVNVERRTRSAVTSEVRQLTVLLLLISGTFLITTAPVVIVKLVIGWTKARSMYRLAQLELLDCIAEMLMYTNHAANFYLYLAVGTRFRREIRKMFRMKRCLGRRRRKHKRYA